MENYENLGAVGEGTYGVVMKCRHKETGLIVAIKKFKESDEDEQVRKTAMREVRILKQLRHDNIVNLIEMFRKKGKLYLVFEYLESTILGRIEKHPYGLPEDEVKKYMYQLLKGIQYCHTHNIIHRDIKPENLLVSKSGILKLCDFGFARTLEGQDSKYTDYVSTRWYRAPELLVGDREYGKPVDIWAVGCMFSEIITGVPLFPGKSDIDQLFKIINCLGWICDRHKEIFHQNPMFQDVELPNPAPADLDTLEKRFPDFAPNILSFMKLCLHQEPERRGNFEDLLQHPYFQGMEEWYSVEIKNLLEKDNIADLSKIRRRERTPSRKEKKVNLKEEEERRRRHQQTHMFNTLSANKENEFHGDMLPNIRGPKSFMIPFHQDRREDLAIPPIGNSHVISCQNDNSQFASLPTLSEFKYKAGRKKTNKRKAKALMSSNHPSGRVGTPSTNLLSSTEFYSMPTNRSRGSPENAFKSRKHHNQKRK